MRKLSHSSSNMPRNGEGVGHPNAATDRLTRAAIVLALFLGRPLSKKDSEILATETPMRSNLLGKANRNRQ